MRRRQQGCRLATTTSENTPKRHRFRRIWIYYRLPMVTVIDGKGKSTVGGKEYILTEGETLIMPKGIPHAVFGIERFKMQLTVTF